MGTEKTFNTIPTLINRNVMLYPDRVAIKEVEGDREYSFTDIKDRANRMGNALYGLGLKKGDRVAIVSQNSVEYTEASFYVPNAGFIFVVCNFRLAASEILAVLTDSEPTALIVQDQFVGMAQQLKDSVKFKLTGGMLATPMVMMILDSPNHKKYDVSSWKQIWFAGAGIIPAVYKKFIDTYGNILAQHHGTTETTGVTTNLGPRDIQDAFDRGDNNILESCGRASFDMEALIVDENGKPVPMGGVGELIVRGSGVTLGYWRKETETKKAFRGEWFHTGDVCSIDSFGYIRVIDRLKDMIITGGENVYPAEIEKVLHSNPAIKESCVIGTPHPIWGEAITAVCVLNEGATITPSEVTEYCKGKIAGYKVPKVVHIVPSLPRNAAGKILKRELREQFGGGAK
jgi:acyl-CoA synthetase (AMP-forming)/AMP-acid ligase II